MWITEQNCPKGTQPVSPPLILIGFAYLEIPYLATGFQRRIYKRNHHPWTPLVVHIEFWCLSQKWSVQVWGWLNIKASGTYVLQVHRRTASFLEYRRFVFRRLQSRSIIDVTVLWHICIKGYFSVWNLKRGPLHEVECIKLIASYMAWDFVWIGR